VCKARSEDCQLGAHDVVLTKNSPRARVRPLTVGMATSKLCRATWTAAAVSPGARREGNPVHSTLIVARMEMPSSADVARIFADFDKTETPHCMGTRRRQLFTYRGLYFHLQDFDEDDGGKRIQEAKADPRFIKISEDLTPFIDAYDPATWRSPADAMAQRFYRWEAAE
jgi:cyclase